MNEAEKSEISVHEVRVFAALASAPAGAWMTNADIARVVCDHVTPRTVRAHTLKLERLGLIDKAEVFPGHHFQIAVQGGKRNGSYLTRIRQAAKVFGVTL